MDSRFYRAFEDRHRGSRALIASRLEVYLPFLAPLKTLYSNPAVLDVGCGRGEWLEILIREGYDASGVDLDEGMLEACRELGLPVRTDDALNALRQLPDASLIAVSGFHIAEHIPFAVLEEMVGEAMRVLQPGGLLILETPNAENVVVGTNNFFVDPTHDRPIPSLLLSFLTEFKGFARSKVLRLQEAPDLRDAERKLGVMDVLAGTSPDYAVVAQKQAADDVLAAFDAPFAQVYGVALDELASRYDQALEGRLNTLENQMATEVHDILGALKAEQAERVQLLEAGFAQEKGQWESELDQARAQADRLRVEMNTSLSNAHNWYLRATALEQQLTALQSSTVWRATAPVRQLGHLVKHPRSVSATAKHGLRRLAPHARLWLARRPAIERKVRSLVQRSPWLSSVLRNLLKVDAPVIPVEANDPQHGLIDHAPLTPRGRQIESALRAAVTKGQK
ncbi:methyltransferase domain-containing protein [Pseudomonas putida]|uniref:class I SAM-dependent methyltransferase n=1 Tax=Pseudomonas putida TaxID=303 RepID=UPI0018E6968F|nr:methyltransferase domain-containing protein [Pseudomonas putida]MBI6941477.1 methyltransferase domain-containing protein [Pseudomonas putida]MBI6957747.1 methyltransferase domain-containing protein [Pseudomonas putida]